MSAIETSLHREAVAFRKLGTVPDGFEWYAFKCVGPDILFTGAVVTGVVTKGPRKGRKRYSKDERSVVVTPAEELEQYCAFEASTGQCGNCKGSGKVFSRWHHIEGVTYRECGRCQGSGASVSRPRGETA